MSNLHQSSNDMAQPARSVAAPAHLVNRTHRVVRERALQIEARRRRVRGLWLPLAVCSGLLLVILSAAWSGLAEDEIANIGVPDASQQIFVLLLWCLPLTAGLLAFVWFRRSARTENGGVR